MGFFDSLIETFLDDHTRREKRFEESVLKKFPRKMFGSVRADFPVAPAPEGSASSAIPKKKMEYRVTHRPSGNEFLIEVTYFPRFDPENALTLCSAEQLARYQQYAEEQKIPLYFIVGLGGIDNWGGEDLFVLPLATVKTPVLQPEAFDTYRKIPQTDFSWEHGHLI